MYLRDAPRDGPEMNVGQGVTQTAESCQDAVWSILQAPRMKADNVKELQRLCDLWNLDIRVIKAFDAHDIDKFLTAIMEQRWMEHSNESKTARPY